MITIRLLLDYDEGPIWPNVSNPYTFEKSSGIDFIDNDYMIKEISSKMSDMYDDYYKFDSHNVACWFDKDKFYSEQSTMLSLLAKLKERLNELNDGLYIVVDDITNMYKENN